jgi:hypothetical protein
MATNGASGQGAGPGSTAEPGLWPLVLRHKPAAAAAVAIAVLAIALTVVPGLIGSGGGPLSDSTTCSAWSAASSARKAAYVQLYLRTYGSFTGAGPSSPAVRNAINHGCIRAGFLGEADELSVLDAVRGNF